MIILRMTFVFGYGSLINPKSIQRTIGREIGKQYLLKARLSDHVRKWQLVDWVIYNDLKGKRIIPAIFLDIVKEQGKEVNGILFELSEKELDEMDRRERNYNRIDVSNLIEPKVGDLVYTYVGKKEYTVPPQESVVLAWYERLVEEGLSFWGKAFRQHYYESTYVHSFPRKDGKCAFIRIK